MPLYEYKCEDCTKEFETLVYSDQEPIECPTCESGKVTKQLSVPARPVSKTLPMGGGCSTQGPPCSPTCCRL